MQAVINRPKQVRNVAVIGYGFHTSHRSGSRNEESELTERLVKILRCKSHNQARHDHEQPIEYPTGWAAVLDRGPVTSLRVHHTASQLATSLQCENDDSIKPKENTTFVLNLIDPPSHHIARAGINGVNPEVTAAMQLVDGALVVVDCVAGVVSNTEAVLSQALSQRVKPVLHMDNMDACMVGFRVGSWCARVRIRGRGLRV